jgi:ankyrin repeat protein
MKKMIFIGLIVSSICFGFIINVKAQLESQKNCGKNEDDECFHTALTIAARKGDAEQVKLLLIMGSPIDERNYFKRTALKEAIIRNKREVVKILIEAGANVNDEAYGWTPLGLAINCASKEIFKDLIVAKADYSEKFANGKTLLIAAAAWGRQDIVEILLDLGADINATDNNGSNALMDAILNSYPPSQSVIKFLISKNININATNHDGLTALAIARRELKRDKKNKDRVEIYSSIIKILQDEGGVEDCDYSF